LLIVMTVTGVGIAIINGVAIRVAIEVSGLAISNPILATLNLFMYRRPFTTHHSNRLASVCFFR
jgi:hypothetical protein